MRLSHEEDELRDGGDMPVGFFTVHLWCQGAHSSAHTFHVCISHEEDELRDGGDMPVEPHEVHLWCQVHVRISHEEDELRDGGGMSMECSVDDMRSFYYLR